MIAYSGSHRGGDPQGLVNPGEIVPHEGNGKRMAVVLDFLKWAFVSLVNRRMLIRIVKFCRSAKLVEICAGSESPIITYVHVPQHCAGL
jgi:hypothetical protein